jgi:hypothetical protein
MEQKNMTFDGATYDHNRDSKRLSGLMLRVHDLMVDGKWRTLRTICNEINANSEASVSARLRDLRKPRFGQYTVEREYLEQGLWRYRVVE